MSGRERGFDVTPAAGSGVVREVVALLRDAASDHDAAGRMGLAEAHRRRADLLQDDSRAVQR